MLIKKSGWRSLAITCVAGVAIACASLAGCSVPQTNFSQHPGFAAYFAAHPPSERMPDAAEQALLATYRPRIFLPPEHPGLIDFYGDYIAQGRLAEGDGKLISAQVTRALLNQHKTDPTVVFTHVPNREVSTHAKVFGRVDHAELEAAGMRQRLTLLTYHCVFRTSGLAAGFDGWRAALVGLVANLDDWHQLDHYTAVTVVLAESGRPVALMLQQHNYHHTYVLKAASAKGSGDAEADGVRLPADGRVTIDVAERSNELYPHSPQMVRHRAVRFGSPPEMRYLLGAKEQPMIAADDITEGKDEMPYTLAFLPPSDAFYTFKGFLGARRKLPGRDGPPGADFNALPEMKPLALQLLMGFWRYDNEGDIARLEATYTKTGNAIDFARAQALPFVQAIDAAAAPAAGQ